MRTINKKQTLAIVYSFPEDTVWKCRLRKNGMSDHGYDEIYSINGVDIFKLVKCFNPPKVIGVDLRRGEL